MLRCPVCRSRRATFVALLAHQLAQRHTGPCWCTGYPFPHRPGSGCCEESPNTRRNRALREKATDEHLLDAMIDDALLNKHKPCNPLEIPF